PARLLADVIARLPNTASDGAALPAGNITLLDSNGKPAYQWGAYTPPSGAAPRASLDLSPPLNSWRLDYFLPVQALDAGLMGNRAFSLSMALLATCLALAGLAIYFYREYSRDVREAAQRVNFVNQVSHE